MNLSVMGSPYAVEFVSASMEMPEGDRESAGCTDIWSREIKLNREEIRDKGLSTASVMLHELIHAVLAESGWSSLLSQYDSKEGLEEALVTALENGLHGHVQFRDQALRRACTDKVK